MRGLLIDFDGTLCDTEHAAELSWRNLTSELGIDRFPADVWTHAVGSADGHLLMETCIGELIGRRLTNEELVWRLHQKSVYADRQPALPGVNNLLTQCIARAIPVAVVSNSPRPWLEHHLERLKLRNSINAIVSGEQGEPKPAPDLYDIGLAALELTPPDVVAIEDSVAGVSAAQSAGLWCLGVGPRSHLTSANASVPQLENDVLDQIASHVGRI